MRAREEWTVLFEKIKCMSPSWSKLADTLETFE
jgi:hypothetical protein